jgi:hypothetical protein
MSIIPIAAYHVGNATEALAHSARPDAPTRSEAPARPRWWRRLRDALRIPTAARRTIARPAPALR